jgi:hypothetical protein
MFDVYPASLADSTTEVSEANRRGLTNLRAVSSDVNPFDPQDVEDEAAL